MRPHQEEVFVLIRAFKAFCLCALVLGGVACGAMAQAADTQAVGGRLPVVLVHGLGGGPWFTWGAPEEDAENLGGLARWAARKTEALAGPGLFARLSADGKGRVFCFAYRAEAPLVESAHGLGEFITGVLHETSASQVDVVTHGSGALVARMCLWEEACPRESVRKVVMIGPPNAGSILANVVHTDACCGNPGSLLRERMAVYLPLFEQFVRQRKLGDPAQRRHITFQGWLRREQPELYASRILAGQESTPDGILSDAYYELVAMEAAVRAYFQKTRDWRSVPLRSWGSGVASALDALARFGIPLPEPAGHAMRLLVTEYVPFDAPPGGDGRIVANSFLHEWNRAEAMEREQDPTWPMYCIVAGEVPNALGLLFPGTGPNDLAVEVSCAYLPLREDDWFVLYRERALTVLGRVVWKLFGKKIATKLGYPEIGDLVKGESLKYLRYSHVSLVRDGDVISRVEKMLAARFVSREEHRPAIPRSWRFWTTAMTGGGLVTRWEPYYVLFDGTRLRGTPGTLYISVSSDTATGRGYTEEDRGRFWMYVEEAANGSLDRREIVAPEGSGAAASATVEGFGAEYARVYLAARVAPPRVFDPASYAVRTGVGYSYAARFFPLEDKGEDAASAAGEKLRESGFKEITAPSPPAGGERATPKLVRVTRPGQALTEMKEKREQHARWEWDFGDGESRLDSDPAHTAVSLEKEFWAPGRYRVSASSYSDAGRLLRRLEWEVEVPVGSGLPFVATFTAETAVAPRVQININGPKEWVTGRVAEYAVEVNIVEPPFGQSEVTVIRPASKFGVVWDKPGVYQVRVAVAVKTTYRFPEGTVAVRNVFAATKSVEVCTTVVTQ